MRDFNFVTNGKKENINTGEDAQDTCMYMAYNVIFTQMHNAGFNGSCAAAAMVK